MNAATEAISEVLSIAQRLPLGAVWSVTLTHDTQADNPAAFNIGVKDDIERGKMRKFLSLGTPDWEDDASEQHDNFTPRITLSIIEVNEENNHE